MVAAEALPQIDQEVIVVAHGARQVAEEGKFAEVSYTAPRPQGLRVSVMDPSMSKQAEKVSFIAKVGQQTCGVGYYKK